MVLYVQLRLDSVSCAQFSCTIFHDFFKFQSYQLYEDAYQQHVLSPNSLTLAAYIELHNNYVQDVHACNAMADQFNNYVLPQLVQVSRQPSQSLATSAPSNCC